MTFKNTCGGKLTQFMTYHVFGNIYGDMFTPVMNRNSVSHHLRENCRTPRPSSDHLFLFSWFNCSTFFKRLSSMKGPFFKDLPIHLPPFHYRFFFRGVTINLLDGCFFLRVLPPIAGLPQGVTAVFLPIGAFPSPPP